MQPIVRNILILFLFSFSLCKKESGNIDVKKNACDNLINDTLTVSDDCFIAVANAFTPNNDGLNDRFWIFFKNIKTVKLLVYDSNNNIIFQTEDLSKQWSPQLTLAGKIYYYRIEAVSMTNKRIGKCGEVYPLECIPKNVSKDKYYFQSQFKGNAFDTTLPSAEYSFCP